MKSITTYFMGVFQEENIVLINLPKSPNEVSMRNCFKVKYLGKKKTHTHRAFARELENFPIMDLEHYWFFLSLAACWLILFSP